MSMENLPPRTLARVSREVRDMVKKVPDGTKLIVDTETGMPQNLAEIMVSKHAYHIVIRKLFFASYNSIQRLNEDSTASEYDRHHFHLQSIMTSLHEVTVENTTAQFSDPTSKLNDNFAKFIGIYYCLLGHF